MQALSAVSAAHWCASVPQRAPPIKRQLLLVGCSKIRVLTCSRKAHAPSALPLKASVEDGAVTDEALASEAVSTTNNLNVEQGSTMKVKFVLERKCKYGQRFNVVGNKELLGNWDVEAAILMDWAEGDIWSVEVDVPVEEQAVEFKFVLTGESGEVEWQPGPNRMFRTIEGIPILVVNETWEGVELEASSATATPSKEVSNEGDETIGPGDVTSVDMDLEGVLVPGDIISVDGRQLDSPDVLRSEESVVEEVVKAFESPQVVDEQPKSEVEPELPLPELDVVVTAAKSALPLEDVPPAS